MGKIFDIISGLVFVPRCCSCNRIIKSDNNCFCDDCNKNIHIIEGKVCGVCGQPLPDYFESPICGRCRNLKHYFNKNISLFKYNDESKNVALNLKYKNYSFIRPVAGLLGDKIKQNVQIDAVTFVPMYKEEELKKGICITYFLAKYTAEKINVPCKEYLIQKRRTAKQKELTANQRIINVHGAYESSGDVKGKRILIIDDVFTTGATLNECSKVLIKSGAKDVYTATIAIRTKE